MRWARCLPILAVTACSGPTWDPPESRRAAWATPRPERPPVSSYAAPYGLDARPSNRSCSAPARPRTHADIQLTDVLGDVRFDQPVAAVTVPGSGGRWAVLERAGRVVEVRVAGGVATRRVLADLTGEVYSAPGETGLLGIAYHPRYPERRTVLLYFTTGRARALRSHLVRFTTRPDGTLDLTSRVVLLELEQPGVNHNGGHLAFGPDGYLYVGVGDGQLNADPPNHAQRLDTLLGSILRLDVDGAPPYAVPPDNPFVGVPGARAEIWAYGLRNPWRFSFDRDTGALWAGDVGQADREEIDRIHKGGNYGWSARQGTLCFVARRGCRRPELIDPVVEYDHTEGFAVVGGYVYRGRALGPLRGRYLFADFGSGHIWSIEHDPSTGDPSRRLLLRSGVHISSFAEDEQGELYVLEYRRETARLLRLDPSGDEPEAGPAPFPQRLSETGCVEPGDPTRMAAGVVPYTIARPFWSDGALKERWVALPEGGVMTEREDGVWDLPPRSVVIKRFRRGGRIIEVRLLVRHDDGFWAGYTYAWDDAAGDGHLIDAGGAIRDAGGGPWIYPSRAQCMDCHNSSAGTLLGLETRQMNTAASYGPRVAPQLATLERVGMLRLLEDASQRPRHSGPQDAAPVETQARHYLHTNCGFCHRPGGDARGTLDLRADVPLSGTGLCGAPPRITSIPGFTDALLVDPGRPERSILVARMTRRDVHGMPRIGSARVDEAGVALLGRWIRALPPERCPAPAP